MKKDFNQQPLQQKDQETIKGVVCTNTIECPFFKQGISFKSVVEKKFEDLTEKDQFKTTKNNGSKNKENIQPPLNNTSEKDKVKNESQLFKYEKYFNEKIESKKKDGSYRSFKKITRLAKPFPVVKETNEQLTRSRPYHVRHSESKYNFIKIHYLSRIFFNLIPRTFFRSKGFRETKKFESSYYRLIII